MNTKIEHTYVSIAMKYEHKPRNLPKYPCVKLLSRHIYKLINPSIVEESDFEEHFFIFQVDLADREVYCSRCTDKVFSSGLDAQAMGIKAALAAPKARRYNQQIHNRGTAPRIPADAMFITQPTSVQNQYQQKYKQTHDKHHFPAFVVCILVLVDVHAWKRLLM